MLEHKNASIARLKRLLFGPRTDKCEPISPHASPDDVTATTSTTADTTPREPKPKARGHGRMKTERYTGAETVRCEHAELRVGQRCPDLPCSGHLYDTNRPSILIRLTGQPLVGATRYEQRCSGAARASPASLQRYLQA